IVTLQIIEEENMIKDIELVDGLIINKENEQKTWLIEAFIKKDYIDYFRKAEEKKEEMNIQVIITNPANDPAPFRVHIHSIKEIDDHISILFEGFLTPVRNEYAELLLDELISEGYSGTELMAIFKKRMQSPPRLATGKEIGNKKN